MQNFTDIPSTRTLSDSLAEILNNDKTAISCSSGTAFPTTNLQLGMLCFRTDQNKLYILKATSPSAVWVEIMDVTASSGKAPNAEAVDGIDGSAVLLKASNLSDLANTATARTNLGIGNVENKSSATIRSEITSANVTSALGYAPQQQDSELTTLAQMSASRATFLASTNDFTFRNRIINGDMRIARMSNGSAVSVSSGYQYGVDRTRGFVGGSGRFTSQISTDAPDGFSNSVSMIVTTSQTSFGASELLVPFEQPIEGHNFSDLAFGSASAKPIAISFYVKASIAGKYSVAVFNNTGAIIDTSYVASVVVNSANTWEYKTLTIPGATIGTWQTGSGIGIYLTIGAYGGSDFIGAENSWQSNFNEFSSGCVNMFGTVGAYLRVTGVQLEPGGVSTPFERISYTQQIDLCERYFRTNREVSGGSASGGGRAAFRVDFSGMRAQPTITLRNTVDVFEGMYYGRYSANTINGFWVPKANDIGIEISPTVSFPSQVPIHMFGDTLNLNAEI